MRTWQQRMAAMTLAAALVGGLAVVMAQQKPAPARAPTRAATAEGLLGTAQYQEQVEGKLEQAIATYKKVLAAPDASTSQKARAQLHIGLCYERLGLEEARRAYQTECRADPVGSDGPAEAGRSSWAGHQPGLEDDGSELRPGLAGRQIRGRGGP